MHRAPRYLKSIAVASIILCAVLLRLGVVNKESLWVDELFSLQLATGHSCEQQDKDTRPEKGDFFDHPGFVTAGDMQQYLKLEDRPDIVPRIVRANFLSDARPPLYYLVLNLWLHLFGDSDLAGKCFSIVASLLCLPLLWLIGKQVGGTTMAFIACILFSVSPLSIYYSTELRDFALLWLLTLSTIWCSIKLNQSGFHLPTFLFWIVATVSGMMVNPLFAFPLGACWLWLLVYPGQLKRTYTLVSIFCAGLFAVPWNLASMGFERSTGTWLQGFPGLQRSLTLAILRPWYFFSGQCDNTWTYASWSTLLACVVLLVIVAVLLKRLPPHSCSTNHKLLYVVLVAVCLGPVLIDILKDTRTVGVARYTLAGMPVAFLLAAAALSKVQFKARCTILLLLIVAWLPSIGLIFASQCRSQENYRSMSRAVQQVMRPGDLVIVEASSVSGLLGLCRYLPPDTKLLAWHMDDKRTQVYPQLPALVEGYERIVLVTLCRVQKLMTAPEDSFFRQSAKVESEQFVGPGQNKIVVFIRTPSPPLGTNRLPKP